jgi:hypothetical protein
MKIYQAVQKLLVGHTETYRQTGHLTNLLPFLESRLKMNKFAPSVTHDSTYANCSTRQRHKFQDVAQMKSCCRFFSVPSFFVLFSFQWSTNIHKHAWCIHSLRMYCSSDIDLRKFGLLVTCTNSRLGGVVVSVLATGPKVGGFKPGRADEFLRAIKIRSTLSFELEVKPDVPCRKILRNVKYPLRYFRYL